MVKCAAIFVATLLWASAARAETALVTPAEALLPPSPVIVPRGPADGPKIALTGPESVPAGTQFSLKAVFTPRPDSSIDPKSVHIILLRGDGVDVTEQVRGAGKIDNTGIDLTGLTAPPGEYRIRVTVDDTRQKPGFADLVLKIETPH
jgi:hypothetical protein